MASCKKEKNEVAPSESETLSLTENVIMPSVSEISSSNNTERATEKDGVTYYGPAVQMGNGYIRSWVNFTKSTTKPWGVGIEFTPKSFENLSDDPMNHAGNTFNLALHQKAKAVTPFDHITINWEPQGHDPMGIYTIPHFDIHFYKISLAEQMMISDVPTALPPAGYLPAAYVIQGATVPTMGTHWLNPNSPELPPTLAPFTHTFIYGSNMGKVHFMEPMITRGFMLAGSYVFKDFPQSVIFSPSGTNYPSAYQIWKTRTGKHYVALTNFSWK